MGRAPVPPCKSRRPPPQRAPRPAPPRENGVGRSPHREASDLPGDRRTKIWELSGSLHCSIIGTCLTASELRRFSSGSATATPTSATTTCTNAELSRRRAARTAASSSTKPSTSIMKAQSVAWRRPRRRRNCARSGSKRSTRAKSRGRIRALPTHPAADAKLVQDVFGDIHMFVASSRGGGAAGG